MVVALLGIVGLLGGACSEEPATRSATLSTSGSVEPDASACDEVVLGIDAFNAGELDQTVAHFRKAVPLAEAEAASDGSQEAEALVDAVHYYAELPAEDYPEAAASSPDFARYKAITLGLCASDGPPAESPSPDGQAV